MGQLGEIVEERDGIVGLGKLLKSYYELKQYKIGKTIYFLLSIPLTIPMNWQ